MSTQPGLNEREPESDRPFGVLPENTTVARFAGDSTLKVKVVRPVPLACVWPFTDHVIADLSSGCSALEARITTVSPGLGVSGVATSVTVDSSWMAPLRLVY